jgi:methylmalonyl-CoA mutase cobalamin-binding subunit
MTSDSDNRLTLSIGAVARATGIPVETLRTWERRYGFPDPVRTEGGHRLYPGDTIHRLRAIQVALAAGHRAAAVVPLPMEELRRLVSTSGPAPEPGAGPAEGAAHWVHLARSLDSQALAADFADGLRTLGVVRFLSERAGPFLDVIGQAWSNGDIEVYHEHFASEQLRDFLASIWRAKAERAKGPVVLLTTLPTERHQLGLHMAATVAANAGCSIAFLGCDTPLLDIERSTSQLRVAAVMISVSRAAERARTRAHLADLRQRIDESVAIVAGGTGAPDDVIGVRTVGTFALFDEWCRALVRQSAA